MKSIIALYFLFSLLLLVKLNQARREPEDYWKNIMRDQPIPESIKDLFVHQDPASPPDTDNTRHFAKDFETKTRAIIYHSHGDQPKRVIRHGEDKVKEEKLLKEKITSLVN